jgi:protein gp37
MAQRSIRANYGERLSSAVHSATLRLCVDATPISRRLMWDQSVALEAFGIERDLFHAGVAAEGIQPLLEAMRTNLEHLYELRAQVLAKVQRAQFSTAILP